MFDRLNVLPLVGGALAGLRRRSSHGVEKADVGVRLVLFGVPIVIAVLLFATQTIIDEAEIMLAAAALLVGALLAGFSQVATWRERILTRGRSIDSVRVRALNEAGALILLSIHASVFGAISVLALTLIQVPAATDSILRWVAVTLSAAGPAALVYVALSVVIVANLLWDAFMNESSDASRDQLKDFSAG